MKRNYEVALLFPSGKSDEEYKALLDRIESWIGADGGNVKGQTHWGRRRLAYQIGLNREGYYVFLDADMESEKVPELERRMNIDTEILRYLIKREDE